MVDTGSSEGTFYDMRFFDPATLYNRTSLFSIFNGTATQRFTYGTVQFVHKGDRGDEVSITLKDQCHCPSVGTNLIAAADLHAYGLDTVLSPDKAQSGLWYDFNTPTARKFATFVEHQRLPYLLPCAIGVSADAHRLAWLSSLKTHVDYVSAIFTCVVLLVGTLLLPWGGGDAVGVAAACMLGGWLSYLAVLPISTEDLCRQAVFAFAGTATFLSSNVRSPGSNLGSLGPQTSNLGSLRSQTSNPSSQTSNVVPKKKKKKKKKK